MKPTRPLLVVFACASVALAGCEGHTATPDMRDTPHVAAALEAEAPTMQEAAEATYWGGVGRRLTLTNGVWENGEGPKVTLLRDYYAVADLNGDGAMNAAVILEATDAGPESGHYLAILRHDQMQTISLGTVLLGHPVVIRGLRVEGRRIAVDLTKRGPGDEECCPTLQATQVYEIDRGGLVDVSADAAAAR